MHAHDATLKRDCLQLACEDGHADAIRLLLVANADVSTDNNQGQTALQVLRRTHGREVSFLGTKVDVQAIEALFPARAIAQADARKEAEKLEYEKDQQARIEAYKAKKEARAAAAKKEAATTKPAQSVEETKEQRKDLAADSTDGEIPFSALVRVGFVILLAAILFAWLVSGRRAA